jgi:methylphosphotriester-DNA--protein-cysteine methyltransferase
MREDMQSLCKQTTSMLFENPKLKLNELAHSLGTDRHCIQRAIKQHYRICFHILKQKVRLQSALTFLQAHPNRNLKEAAAHIGVTPNHLSFMIKSITDLSCLKS